MTKLADLGGGKRRGLAILTIVLLLAPALALILTTTQVEVVEASPNDNFGYDTIGEIGTASLEYCMRGSLFICPSTGVATSITVYLYDEYGATKQAAIYKQSDSTLLTNGTTEIKEDVVNPAGWLTFTFSTLPTLEADTEYVLVVRAEDVADIYYDEGQQNQGHYEDGGLASFPATADFTRADNKYSIYCTYVGVSSKPVLVSPENASSTFDNRLMFLWENGTGADNNRIEVSDNENFIGTIDNEVVLDNTWTKTGDGYLRDETYFWRVIAVNAAGENESLIWNFTVVPLPSQPQLQSPENETTATYIPYFEWENGIGANYHRIEVDDDSDFSSVIDNENITGDNTWTKTGGGYPVGTYYWRVAAVNQFGENQSENEWTFTIDENNIYASIIYAGDVDETWVNHVRMPQDNMKIKVHVTHNVTIENVILEWYDNGSWENFEMADDGGDNYSKTMTSLENERDYSFDVWVIGDGVENELQWLRRDNTYALVRRYVGANYAPVDNLEYDQFYFHNVDYPESCTFGVRCLEHEQMPDGSVLDTNVMQRGVPTTIMYGHCDDFVLVYMNENLTISNGTAIENIYYYFWWYENFDDEDTPAYLKNMRLPQNTEFQYRTILDTLEIDWENDNRKTYPITGQHWPEYILNCGFWDLVDNEYASNDIYEFSLEFWRGASGQDIEWVSMEGMASYIIINLPDNSTLAGMDSDSDGWDDNYELYTSYTNPFQADTDADGLQDNIDADPLIPTAPTLYLPENDSEAYPQTYFEWEMATNADNHRLLVDNDEGFSSPNENRFFTTDNHYTIPSENALPRDNYWWEVIASYAGTERISDVWTFEVRWYLVESWSGTVEASPAEWNLIESWTGTADTQVSWGLLETWTGTIEAFAVWNSIESWTGTVEAFAEWSSIETWTGTVHGVGWRLTETWTGTVQNPSAEVTTESATDVGMTIATLNALVDYGSYPDVDIRFQYRVLGAGVWDDTAWEEDYTATLYSKAVTGLSSSTTYQFRGHIEFGSFENFGSIVEFTTQSEAPPTEQWYLKETWTGTIQTEDVVRWRSTEAWEGTIMTVAAEEEEEPEGPGGPGEPEEEEEPPPVTLPLGIGAFWSLLLAVCFIWLSAFKAGPRKRRWARNFIYIIGTCVALTLVYISTEGITLSLITMVVGAWGLIFVVAVLYLSSIEAGSWRQRMTKQFFYVLITLTVLTLIYLGVI